MHLFVENIGRLHYRYRCFSYPMLFNGIADHIMVPVINFKATPVTIPEIETKGKYHQ